MSWTPWHEQQLFAFCKKHYVRDYDLQLELVDHLSESIQSLMQEEKISFESALEKVHRSFGYKGFAGIVEAKQQALWKQAVTTRKKIFFSWFTPPRLAKTLGALTLIFLSLQYFPPEVHQYIFLSAIIMVISFEIIVIIDAYRRYRKFKRPLMLLRNMGQFPILFTIALQLLIHLPTWSALEDPIQYKLFTGFVVLLLGSFFLLILSFREFYLKLFQEAERLYPAAMAVE